MKNICYKFIKTTGNTIIQQMDAITINHPIIDLLVKGCRPLTGSKLKDFKVFLEKYADKIVEKWVDYFVYHKNIEFERINTKIK